MMRSSEEEKLSRMFRDPTPKSLEKKEGQSSLFGGVWWVDRETEMKVW